MSARKVMLMEGRCKKDSPLESDSRTEPDGGLLRTDSGNDLDEKAHAVGRTRPSPWACMRPIEIGLRGSNGFGLKLCLHAVHIPPQPCSCQLTYIGRRTP